MSADGRQMKCELDIVKSAIRKYYITEDEQKKALVEKVTDAVVETTGAPKEKVVIFIEELQKEHYAIGGKRLSE